MKNQVAILILAALYFQQGEALKCYVCSSATDTKCSDPIDSSLTASECTPDVFKQGAGALKSAADSISSAFGNLGINVNIPTPDSNTAFTCVKAVRQDGDKRVVVRSCSIPKTNNFDFCDTVKASGGGIVTFCDSCTTDACNTASGVVTSSGLMFAAALVLVATLLGYQ